MPHHRGSGSESDNDFEAERARTIARNREQLQQLGIADSKKELPSAARKTRVPRIRPAALVPPPASDTEPAGDAAQPFRRVYPLRERRPSQAAQQPAPKRSRRSPESDEDSSDEDRPRRNMSLSCTSTIFDESHVLALGAYTEPFQKDYDEEYMKADSTTCHQCRQKITGPKTECSECDGVRGQFCGKCLFNRYGENLYELTDDWTCPNCRDICNCSFCYRATGQLVNKARKQGYLSAAHMIILTSLQDHLECEDDRTGGVFVVRNKQTGAVVRVLPRYRHGRLPAVPATPAPDTPDRGVTSAGIDTPSSATHS